MDDHQEDEPVATIDWYGPDAATFGDRVAAARESSGMTQAQLARRLGVKLSTIESWENDLSEPRANRLSIMAGLMNVSIMWLLNGEGEGVDVPGDAVEITPDINNILGELRDLKGRMRTSTDKLGQLEKRLRRALRDDHGG